MFHIIAVSQGFDAVSEVVASGNSGAECTEKLLQHWVDAEMYENLEDAKSCEDAQAAIQGLLKCGAYREAYEDLGYILVELP